MRGDRGSRVRLVALICALALPLAPASAAAAESPQHIDRVVGGGAFTKDGVTYRLRLVAAHDRVAVVVSRLRDPDGDGPRASRQSHTYHFRTGPRVVTETDSGVRVATGDALAPWGRVGMTFRPRGEPVEHGDCETRQRGRLHGVLRLRTHTRFGAVEMGALRGVVVRGIDACGPIAVAPIPQCPPPAWRLTADHRGGHRTDVLRYVHRKRAWVSTTRGGPLSLRDPRSSGGVHREILLRIEASRARFADDLSAAVVRGARGTDVRGGMRFAATGGVGTDVAWCEPGREVVLRRRPGVVTGTMRFAFFIGPDRDLEGRRLDAGAAHSRNRSTE